ncbi:MAG: hypothetical protein GC181_13545 [Bacteroidetes bacterium]|nr:hypothetical protein [Bacteroidota bacterium]
MAKSQISETQSEWQQRVDYEIEVRLDDQKHMLYGWVKMVYKNNSKVALNEMYMHLWPNAYSDRNTPFAKQQMLNGNLDFYFSELSDRGFIDSLDFKMNGTKCQWQLLPEQSDIARLNLPDAIAPGKSVTITTPFRVKVPGSFSRMGHEAQSYQITQWFPKPAVYDVNGWNPISYLDQGEFYSEFGSFKVKITVPENYVIAATGVLQEKEEWSFIRKRRDNPISTFTGISSSEKFKTLTYVQDSIHDFAWFASKYFNVEESSIKLKNGHTVQTFVFAEELKPTGTSSINEALKFYSEHCGYYPYKYCTAVKGALKAGGGMEYPMITVLDGLSREVIIHEVGHNWFYGMLANNERRYPWMDESINSFFEGKTMFGDQNKPVLNSINLTRENGTDWFMEAANISIERAHLNQAVADSSEQFSSYNYGVMVYGKGSLIFDHLRGYLGDEMFYNCFRKYFDKWAFHHPLPGDMEQVFVKTSGKDLSWFFGDLMHSEAPVDYRVNKVEDGNVLIENVGGIKAPYSVGYYYKGELQKEIWYDGHTGVMKHPIPSGAVDLIKIDPRSMMAESNRKNNSYRLNSLFGKIEPLNVDFSIKGYIENPDRTTMAWSPIIGWNSCNRGMIGVLLNNPVAPVQKYNFVATPMYAFGTKDLNGYFNFAWHRYGDNKPQDITFGMKSARFAYAPSDTFTYNRIAPYVSFKFRNKDKRYFNNTVVTLKYTNTSFTPKFDQDAKLKVLENDISTYNRRTFTENLPDQFFDFIVQGDDGQKLNHTSYKLDFQYGMIADNQFMFDSISGKIISKKITDNFAKLSFTFKHRINYSLKNKGLDIRVFAGVMLDKADNGLYQYRIGSQGGRYDYTFEETALGRNQTSGVFVNQVMTNNMFVKAVGNFGNIDGYTVSANLVTDLPGKLPLHLYADIFTFNDIKNHVNNTDQQSFGYTGGVSLRFAKDVFEIYFPLVSSSIITKTQDAQQLTNYKQQISFTLNLNKLTGFSLEDMLRKAL